MAELLAPAGSLSHVWTAINAGADAVYLGGKAFGARKFAHNLDHRELERAVETAHMFGVKVYVTVNIVIADTEREDLKAYLQYLDVIAVDGVIVQDLAVAALARDVAPALPLHGSTQMTVADLAGVRQLEALGFTQVVLARELSLPEISSICSQTKMAVEVFIHGASCMSYSGQCLMSSFMGGRSGNRGSCAQPCRLPFRLLRDGKAVTTKDVYLLSLKDLCAAAYIPDLVAAGVSSFKIEGRMKNNGYVRNTVFAYRRILDSCTLPERKRQEAVEEGLQLLRETFNRSYQADFLTYTVGRKTVTEGESGNRGMYAGVLLEWNEREGLAALTTELQAGDIVKVCHSDGRERIDEIKAVNPSKEKGSILEFRCRDLFPGDLYRLARQTDREQSAEALRQSIPLYCHLGTTADGRLVLTVWDEAGHSGEVYSAYVPEPAHKRPATRLWLKTQLDRLGDTVFSLADATIWDETMMIPSSVINELRRRAVELMKAEIRGEYKRPRSGQAVSLASPVSGEALEAMEVTVRCDTVAAVKAAAANGADRVIFGGESYHHRPFGIAEWREAAAAVRAYGCQLWASTPRIERQENAEAVSRELALAAACHIDGVYIGALGAMELLRQLRIDLPVNGDMYLNIFNATAAAAYVAMGCTGLALSPELTLRQIGEIAAELAVPVEICVAGRQELMVTEYCPIAAFAGTGRKRSCPAVCMTGHFSLADRKGESFPLMTDQYCRTHILNGKELNIVPYYRDLQKMQAMRLRLEARGCSPQWVAATVRQYRKICDGTETMLFTKDDRHVTRGHFFHSIIGK